MKKDSPIKIKSSLHREISTNVVIAGKKYLILTEDIEPKDNLITTTVYLGGKIILTKNIDFKDSLKAPARKEKIVDLVHRQHERIAEMIGKEQSAKVKTPSDYLDEVKTLLQRKNNKNALAVLTLALERYPSDPFLLSYYGCLEAIINKNYASGIDTCLMAIEILNERIPFGREVFYPTFYLNLGRAYSTARNRKEAAKAFQKGLSFDRDNKDLIWEMKKLGIRRKPVVSYLKRSNPINKYVGMILHTLKKVSR
jgi:tetratricopeptide (TPR) repeat protein